MKDAALFLHKNLPITDKNLIKKFFHEFGYHPLAIKNAIIFIKDKKISVNKFLLDYKNDSFKEEVIFNKSSLYLNSINSYISFINTTLNEESKTFLTLLSFLGPNNIYNFLFSCKLELLPSILQNTFNNLETRKNL